MRRRTCERGAREERLHLRFRVSKGLCEVCGTFGRLQGGVALRARSAPPRIFITDDRLVTSPGPGCGVQVESNLFIRKGALKGALLFILKSCWLQWCNLPRRTGDRIKFPLDRSNVVQVKLTLTLGNEDAPLGVA